MNNTGPITKNGIHPITHIATTVVKEGVAGAAKPATPKAAQIPAAGANPGSPGGKHLMAGKQEKSMADTMYPKTVGLKGVVSE